MQHGCVAPPQATQKVPVQTLPVVHALPLVQHISPVPPHCPRAIAGKARRSGAMKIRRRDTRSARAMYALMVVIRAILPPISLSIESTRSWTAETRSACLTNEGQGARKRGSRRKEKG